VSAKGQGSRVSDTTESAGPKQVKKRYIAIAIVAFVALVVGGKRIAKQREDRAYNVTFAKIKTALEAMPADGIDDVVSGGGCTVDEYGISKFTLLATNSTTAQSDYLIEVAFKDSDGVKVGDGVALIQNVAAGTQARGVATGSVVGSMAKCVIVSVKRQPS
jgi:hypothetical protein